MDKANAILRHRMVEEQIRRRNVTDPATLKSMEEVPRHLFVPPELHSVAYEDGPLPIGEEQTISQPYIVALMTQAAELTPQCSVLDIGTGSGYAAAVLSRIVKEVYTVERIASLSEKAVKVFQDLGYTNIHATVGDGTLGWPEKAPFNAIIVTAGAPVIPESLLHQLKADGRIIIPIGDTFGQQLLRYRKKSDGTFSQELLEYVRFVPLIGKEGWKE